MRRSHPPLPRLALLTLLLASAACGAAPSSPQAPASAEPERAAPTNTDAAPGSETSLATPDSADSEAPRPDGAPAPLSTDFLNAAESASQRRDAATRARESWTDPDEGRPVTSGKCVGVPSKAAQAKVRSEATCCYIPPSYFIKRIQTKNEAFRACYTEALKRRPDTRGRVTSKFTIEEDGSVSGACDAGSTVADPAMVECVLRVFTTVAFESYTLGGPCPAPTLMYPMRFSPES